MEIKVGDVFRFAGTDEGVFCMNGADLPSVRLTLIHRNECWNTLEVTAPSDGVLSGMHRLAADNDIAEVLERVA
jgi:hypothetical protein